MSSSSSSLPSDRLLRPKLQRKRNRSTSVSRIQIDNDSSSNHLDLSNHSIYPRQGTSSSLHSMTHQASRTLINDCSHLPSSPSKQIFQHFPSWPSLTNSTLSPAQDPEPPKKRRKGVAGAILSTALEAALFTSAIGYAAYNFWCGKDLEQEETTRLSPKARSSRSVIANPSLLPSPPPPPYEPPDQVPEQVRMTHAPRKPLSNRSAASHRLYSSRPAQVSSSQFDLISFILRPNPTSSINHSFNLNAEAESIKDSSNSYAPTPPSMPIVSSELDDDEDEEDDEELKAFKAQIQGLIKEGREALASRPSIPTCITHSSSSSSLRPPTSRIIDKSRRTTINTHFQTVVTSTDKFIHPIPPSDENVQLLQRALDSAALPSHSNWWER